MKPIQKRFNRLFPYILIGLGLFGCSEERPDGLPKLQPVSLQFTQDGLPCSEASVHLVPQDESPWAVGGSTDTTGTVIFKTHGKFTGVPAGKYKVTVSKVEREEVGPKPQNMYESQEIVMYDLIDQIYSDPKMTPLEIDVLSGKKLSESFDLGKKIRVKIVKPGN
ncbi:MAG: carboxypeptidase-like regulatory domain-containing protein [Planctomycetaceae bacterium]|jgi:hypothetical protein|nr:carboxypeptidase-like regulatory domain-containing protein [Planctomycetaceae bacterium]